MFINVSAFVAVTTVVLGFASASPTQETNAKRLAQGLPPNPPAYLARSGTAVRVAKRAAPSSHPPVCYSGRIEVRPDPDGSRIGYVRNWENGGIGGVNFSGEPLEVRVCEAGSGLYDIIATNAVFPPPFYVGAGSGVVARTLSTGNRSSVAFSNVAQTPPNATPTLIDGNYVESAIWSYNPSTNELKPQWINADGSRPATVIAYDIRANGLFFVGDISQWNVSGSFASEVYFFLV